MRPPRTLHALLGAAWIAAALPLGPAAMAQAPSAPTPPKAEAPARFDAARQALATAMSQSAGALRAGHRHEATRALDRARRLARFGDTAWMLGEPGRKAFRDARHGVEEGRKALQNGAPHKAADILQSASQALAQTPLGEAEPRRLDAQAVSEAEGRTVLNAQGEEAGTLEGYAAEGDAILVSQGGFLGIGARTIRLPADQVLLGQDYALTLAEPAGAGGDG
ncbi:hypothetical protein QMO56_22075 [Roseomonas sp. E05]|uniref:hypothetical protein n=1 Tax=Roseomonas sp. E05 TaxID=3046310 RepID=UPI0024B999B4|nr:hypothetical protein [Roseomonas sp. E05]MDJ0390808.1 hypothetical protein [Roseomonas sp. E05]